MPIPTNDEMLFDMEGTTPEVKPSDDITLPTEDKEDKKEDAPADEKKEVKGDEPKPEDAKPQDPKPEDKKEEAPKEELKPEDKKEEDPDDLDLSDLFADLDDAKEAGDKSKEIIDAAAAAWTMTPEQIADLQAQLAIQKEINDKNSKMIKSLMTQSVDMTYKNAELEAFGWVWTDPNVLILSKNMEKAKSGDDKSKSKVVTILKNLYEELTGEDLDKSKVNQEADIMAAADAYNSKSNPNLQKKASSEVEWLSL